MGSKQSIVIATQYYFFQKNVFGAKKSSKQLDVLLIFEFFCQYKCISKISSENRQLIVLNPHIWIPCAILLSKT
jgi:hypothetical protein